MRGRWQRFGVALTALSLGAVGLVPAGAEAAADPVPFVVPGTAVPLAQAGEVALWGDNAAGQSTVPAALAGVAVTQVVRPSLAGLALTADGRVVGWGSNPERLDQVPPEVSAVKVAQIAAWGGYAGAVTTDGRVLTWGKKRQFANPLNVPAGLSGVRQLAMAEYSAAALKDDGSVVAWGQPDWGQTDVPAGLRATAVVAMPTGYLALTDAGTVVGWGQPPAGGIPDVLRAPGSVRALTASPTGALALMADDSLVWFGGGSQNQGIRTLPPGVAAADPMLLATGGGAGEFAIVDGDRAIHYWQDLGGIEGEVPSDLDGRDLVQVALGFAAEENNRVSGAAVITKMLRAELPRISGAGRVGDVLTGVPGTFSAAPDGVASQWRIDGVPVAGGGSQLTVTPAMVGRSITYESVATKSGEDTVSAVSTALVVPPPVVPPVASSTKLVKVTVAKKATKVVVASKVTASASPAGRAKVTIAKGKKVIVAKTVSVSAAGTATLTVKKFGKLAIKKTKSKSKTGYRGTYVVTIAYLGNPQVTASSGKGKFAVKK
jgi:hypothetical protein